MAASVVYTNFGGMLVHEERGGVERSYVSDTLGSLIAEMDSTGAVTYEAEYWPYGEIQTESGTQRSSWGFVGLLGYLRDLANLLYVRARHYLPNKGRWLTVDTFWPLIATYSYASSAPAMFVDPSGMLPPNVWAGILASIISCLLSAGISLIGSFLSGESAKVAACKAASKCLLNGLAAGIGVGSMNPGLACALSIVANLLSAAADALCPCLDGCCDPPDPCDLLKAAFGGAAACLGFFGLKDHIVGWVEEIFGWIAREIGKYGGSILSSFFSSLFGGTGKIICDWAPRAFPEISMQTRLAQKPMIGIA